MSRCNECAIHKLHSTDVFKYLPLFYFCSHDFHNILLQCISHLRRSALRQTQMCCHNKLLTYITITGHFYVTYLFFCMLQWWRRIPRIHLLSAMDSCSIACCYVAGTLQASTYSMSRVWRAALLTRRQNHAYHRMPNEVQT